MIPKPGGGERPLGIPTIRDRVVQTAAKLVLEPIFEADFDDGAYGYAIFLAHRKREVTDGLVDLLVDIVHKIRSQAKHTTVRRLSQEIERIHGKETLLVRTAEAATGNPDGTVREVVFPAVGEDVLSAVIREQDLTPSPTSG
jgi:hypothetical protein